MTNRKAISNKLRFEVFKRDSFKCQYCGSCAPDVVLNVDHINPVAKGGKNDILNLITSCFSCNNGKSDRLMSDTSVVAVQRRQLEELNEKRNQIDMMIEWKKGISDKSYEINSIVKYFNDTNGTSLTITETGMVWLKQLMSKYSLSQLIDGVNTVNERYAALESFERFDKLESAVSWNSATDSDKWKMKIYGAIKRKFSKDRWYSKMNIVKTNQFVKKSFTLADQNIISYQDILNAINSCDRYDDLSDHIDYLIQY